MFTGIIEELGTITQVLTNKDSQQITIRATIVLADVKLGDSIAINGVCLTVTSFTDKEFCVDVMPETYKCTSLAKIKIGTKVNLERAMAVGSRLGGHFVTGHVDGVGEVTAIKKNNNAIEYKIKIPEELTKYCMYKGSIAIDGTSLTIFGVENNIIIVSLIPHTVEYSVLGMKVMGDIVNIECDMLGKYIVQHLDNIQKSAKPTSLSKDFLTEQGFI